MASPIVCITPLPSRVSSSSASSRPPSLLGAAADCFNIKWRELKDELQSMIGSGSFGQVYHAVYHHEDVAVKVITIDREEDFDEEAVERFK